MDLPKPIRIAVATDLHYVADQAGKISTQVCIQGSKIDPMLLLIEQLKSPDTLLVPKAHVLICPGDITTRACVRSFNHGWSDLNNLKVALDAGHLIAATGNHEISSRTKEDHATPGNAEIAIAPFEHLLTTSDYPAKFANPEQKWVYWGRGYESLYGEDWVVVTVNTCHYHNSLLPNEYERGRIGDAALAELSSHLKSLSGKYSYKIIVLHHPPLDHEDLGVSLGRTPMYNGNLLLQEIENTGEDWLVIHGHKHLFRLTKSSGTEYSPVVLGAASFGAMLTGDMANRTKNQFYIIELSMTDEDGKARLRGEIDSLYWDGSAWSTCNEISHGLPHKCGFDQANPARASALAKRIKETIEASSPPVLTWSELREKIEALRYLMPKEIDNLQKRLDDIGVARTPNQDTWFPQELWVDHE